MAKETQPSEGEAMGTTSKGGSAKRGWLIGLVVLVLIAGGGVFWLNRSPAKKAAVLPSLASAEQSAANASNLGQYAQALSDLQAVTSEAHTTQQKVKLYDQIAVAAQNANHLSLAIQYYQKKHELDPGTIPTDSYLFALLYQRANENTQAIAQYKIYITYLQAHPEAFRPYNASDEIASVNATIKSLEAQQ